MSIQWFFFTRSLLARDFSPDLRTLDTDFHLLFKPLCNLGTYPHSLEYPPHVLQSIIYDVFVEVAQHL